jgi:flagellar hook-associated protein 2
MATSVPTINFGGLASGLDTNSIVDQLMSIERQPQNRLKLKQGQIDARKSALSDIQSRLKNLQLAAQDLKSPLLWIDTQTVDVNDPTKVAATRTGGAGTGGYQLTVTQLASASQHWFSFPSTPTGADDTITFTYGGGSTKQIVIPAGSDIVAAANTINSDSGSPVYASVVTTSSGTKYLAFSSKTTGAASDFSASDSGGLLVEDATKAVTGLNAQGTVGTQSFDEPTNVIADMIPGVQLTLKGVTGASPVTVTVGAPGPDQAAISAKVKAFVDQYNSTIDLIRSKLSEKPVPNPQTAADYAKGVLYGDTALTGLLGQMRLALTDQYAEADGNPLSLDQLSEIGVSTGAAVGSGTLNQDSIAGKLTFDPAKLTQALATDQLSVRRLLGGDTSVPDGFGKAFDALLTPMVQANGTLDQTIRSEDSQRRILADQIADMDEMLAKKQELLKQQFTAMEQALQASQSQGQWLSGQLAALNNNR